MNQYIDAFLSDIPWLAQTNDIELICEEKMVVPYDFRSKFPQMSKLLERAVKLEIAVTEKKKTKNAKPIGSYAGQMTVSFAVGFVCLQKKQ